MRRALTAGMAAVLALAAAICPNAAWAAGGELTLSGLRQEAGLVEFYLSARGLPAGTRLDRVEVTAAGQPLAAQVQQLAAGRDDRVPRRAVVLVLDTSGSMNGAPLRAARSAASRYLRDLPADVEVGIVAAGAPAALALAPTADRSAADRALAALAAKGETALYDGVKLAGGALTGGGFSYRRIVALSDGADTASTATADAARQGAGQAGIAVDTIAFRTPDDGAAALAGLATGTGGTAYQAADTQALAEAFVRASSSLSMQVLVRVTVPAALSGQHVKLAVAVGGAVTELPLDLAVNTSVSEPLTGVAAPPPGGTWLLVLLVLVFLGLLGLALLVISPVFSTAERRRRLAQVDRFVAPQRRAAQAATDGSSQVTAAALALSAQVVKSTKAEGRLATQLDRAGLRLRPHEWLLLRALACFTAAMLLTLMANLAVGLFFGPVLGWAATSLYHRRRSAGRMNAFRDALPDALQLVVGSLRSGFSLAQAIDAMVRELPDPISTEFGRALGETRLGADLEDALDRLATRMGSKDLAWAVVAVRVQREVGGNLAEVLANTIESMREREQLYREVRSLSAEGRLSAWVLLALPVGVGAFMLLIRGEYIRPLYTEPLGIMMSVIGVALVVVGAFWLNRLVKIEV
ncbi:type II secretion system F family protein [Catellatospora sp. KI3]|uniref:type II secretion system F family protein n=1 Tax=Catellatospora sp. KI3 TaxID=3041620 RepID=UPI00248210A3|nr:type II secretion system F family protein [Catellatospora sp. KI3]MDI1461710.1 type II secretion system F family protein [Catellatospora sp. KI3]